MVTAKAIRNRKSKSINRKRARDMRHEATDAERKFWLSVRDRRLGGYKFRRQVLIANCIADFACIERRLVVEIDGGQHETKRDAARDRLLATQGFRVVRFWNNDVMGNLDGVLHTVLAELEASSPHPDPLPPRIFWGGGDYSKHS